VDTTTDPAKVKAAVDSLNGAVASAKSEAALQNANQKAKVAPVKNSVKQAIKADFSMQLTSRQCMRFAGMNDKGEVIALHAQKQDLYHPKKSGVFNVVAQLLQPGTVNQRWKYDAGKKAIVSHMEGNLVLSEGANENLFLYQSLDLEIQKFQIDLKNGLI